MADINNDINHWADANGQPIPGSYREYLNWFRLRELRRRKTLPLAEQLKLTAADESMKEKMLQTTMADGIS
jgi:hypothetical protein